MFFYDGWQLKDISIRWKNPDALPAKRAIEFVRARDGTVFLFTLKDGLYKLAQNSSSFEHVSVPNVNIAEDSITAVTFHESVQVVTFIAGNRVFVLALGDGVIREVMVRPDTPPVKPVYLVAANRDQLHIFFQDGVVKTIKYVSDRYDLTRSVACPIRLTLSKSITHAGNNTYYVLDELGKLRAFELTGIGCEVISTPKALADVESKKRINSLAYFKESDLLALSTDKGLVLFNGERGQSISVDNSSLVSNDIMAAEELSADHVLVGTFRGATQLTKTDSYLVTKLGDEHSPSIVAISSSVFLGTFVATYNRVYREQESPHGLYFLPIRLPSIDSGISALVVTKLSIWVGFHNGTLLQCVLSRDDEDCAKVTINETGSSPITSLGTDSLDQESERIFVTRLNGEILVTKTEQELLDLELLHDRDPSWGGLLLYRPNTKIGDWVVDFEGAWRVIPTQDHVPLERQHLENSYQLKPFNKSWAISIGDAVSYFASSSGWVEAHNNSMLNPLQSSSPLWRHFADEAIYALEVDEHGRPWFATKTGISIGSSNGAFRLQIPTVGREAISIDYGASHSTKTGSLYFGGTGGLIAIKNTLGFPKVLDSEVVVRQVSIDGKSHQLPLDDPNPQVNLKVDSSALTVKLGINDFPTSPPPSFEYKLDGYDHDWHSTGRSNSAGYTSLPPGDYVFRARGADADGIWSKNEIAIPVHVAVPTWRSWWALVLYSVLAGATLLLLRRWHEQLVTQRTRLQLAEESAAAYARLEDDYQAQQEVTDYLLHSKTPAALALLTAVQELISARSTDEEGFDNSSTGITIDMLQTLRTVQEVTSRSLSAETTDMHALTDEISARMAQSHPGSADAIIVNDVTSSPIPLSHALLLGLVLHEVLILATSSTRHDDVSPIVRIAMEPAQYDNSNQLCYQLSVEDSGQPATDDQRLESYLAFGFHLVESYGGDIERSYDRGNRIDIRLMLPEDTGRLD